MDPTNDIKEALELLDPTCDDHWTAQGLPSVAAVKELSGSDVTRMQIDALAPGLCRDSVLGSIMPQAEAESEITAKADEGKASIDDQIVELDRRISAARKAAADAIALGASLERDRSELVVTRDALYPPETRAQWYKKYLDRQTEERRLRVEKAQQVAALMGGVSTKSPLDRAMSHRRAFGAMRPSYPTIGGK